MNAWQSSVPSAPCRVVYLPRSTESLVMPPSQALQGLPRLDNDCEAGFARKGLLQADATTAHLPQIEESVVDRSDRHAEFTGDGQALPPAQQQLACHRVR